MYMEQTSLHPSFSPNINILVSFIALDCYVNFKNINETNYHRFLKLVLWTKIMLVTRYRRFFKLNFRKFGDPESRAVLFPGLGGLQFEFLLRTDFHPFSALF